MLVSLGAFLGALTSFGLFSSSLGLSRAYLWALWDYLGLSWASLWLCQGSLGALLASLGLC